MKRLLHFQFLLVLLLALGYSSLQAKRITMAGSATGLQFLGKTDAAEGKGEEQGGYYRIAL